MKAAAVLARLFLCLAFVAGGGVAYAFVLSEEGKAEIEERKAKIAELKQKAEQGDAEAAQRLGSAYSNGSWGMQKDESEGTKWYRLATEQYRQAAEQGDADAQFKLGYAYQEGRGVKQDYAEAAKWFLLAAKQGNRSAQYAIAELYLHGEGVEKSKTEAVKWRRLLAESKFTAAEKGDADAQEYLGDLYTELFYSYYSKSIGHDITEALKWYRLAAGQGKERAKWRIAKLESNIKETQYLRKKAEQGDSDAQYKLGLAYRRGKGVNEDHAEAAKWLRLAAEQDNRDAKKYLGYMYSESTDLKNDAEAAKWYRLAAEQGDKRSQYRLGSMYEKGVGVEKDNAEAAKWYRLAAERGDSESQYRLGSMYEKGVGVEKDDAEAAKWFRKATANRYGPMGAFYKLGLMYEEGKGVERNEMQAFKLFYRLSQRRAYGGDIDSDHGRRKIIEIYRSAAERGDAYAQYELALIHDGLHNSEKEIKWYRLAAKQGNKNAQYKLAKYYDHGLSGIVKDRTKAENLYLRAAKQGHAEAQNRLGVMSGGSKAKKWYRLAAEQGDVNALNNLGIVYEYSDENLAEAIKWYRRAAEHGNDDARKNLGDRYFNGNGVARDYRKAYIWYSLCCNDKAKSAKAKLTSAQIESADEEARKIAERNSKRQEEKREAEWKAREEAALKWRRANVVPDLRRKGDAYYKGKGVLPNYKEAAKWYRQAAERGDSESQYRLGLMYSEGKRGIEQNNVEAYIWLALAGVNDTGEIGEKAASLRESVEKNLTSEQFDQAQAEATKRLQAMQK